MYVWMLGRAEASGYEHYEISNLCRPGFASRHNTKYWTGAPYLGFGCSAHSYDGKNRRWSNQRDVARYVDLVESGESAVVESHRLSEEEARAEALFLGMRLMRGIDMREYRAAYGIDLRDAYEADLSRFQEAGLVEFEGDLIKLTRTGALLSNEVLVAFV